MLKNTDWTELWKELMNENIDLKQSPITYLRELRKK